ncbi:c-type cytochrome [Mucilaginibacter roseus]|uniref:C-type cytochrome n=1 Tax=Mucilaginibacter roseus TaxID=1528868 RepID=A0ABS8TW95_9SPHI|nr:c-type cytochrome [Mucilaginibacter roseus]MCD8739144.1 c-type cytochrome [Mucilaginibacter roseus]
MARMQLEPGYEVNLVAAEPLVVAPVAINFDNGGRLWAVEMTGYMPDTAGRGEDAPTGKIVILDDDNRDGVYDRRTVFIDSLRLPRALCFINGGVLVAEPPRLWFYPIENDKPGKRTLVDPKYTEDGNVEHQPNGLLRAIDNWIYNAKSSKRYRFKDGKWLIERTHFRGQWGISQDNYGRLYYNDNSSNVIGDFFLPGFGYGNLDQQNVAGYSERMVADNRVYPARPTPGVNRGYTKGTLDEKLRLRNFTAACAPLVYRGGLLKDSLQSVFVAEPSANLIKRNQIQPSGNVTRGRQAYTGHEFLASTDERFRPVNLNDGPDGALYVTDMYRGIIQHKTYLTEYLKNEIVKRQLSQPLNCGRIYKVIPKNFNTKVISIPTEPDKLVELLGNANGWVRDRAQQTIVDQKMLAAVPYLQQALAGSDHLKTIHALWTLEGLNALNSEQLIPFLSSTNAWLRVEALGIVPSVVNKASYKTYSSVLQRIVQNPDEVTAPYIAYLYPVLSRYDKPGANKLLKQLATLYPQNKYVADAVISNLSGREAQFTSVLNDTAAVFVKRLNKVINNRKSRLLNNDPVKLKKEFPRGAAIFSTTCQTCHGGDGNGIKGLAPPFNKSQWVTGDKRKLIGIVLNGLTGPVEVNDHLYKAPEINGDMPGIGGSKEISDEDIAQLLSFLRRSWQNKASAVTVKEVSTVRSQLKERSSAFTIEELEKVFP